MPRRSYFQQIDGSVTTPRGFRAAGVFCDIKRLGTGKGSDKGNKRDLALIVSDTPAAMAGVFTTNRFRAAPVEWCLKIAGGQTAQAIVANSGNANAGTGRRGLEDAAKMARLTSKALSIPAEHVLVCSTGRIGPKLPMPNVEQGIRAAAQSLGTARSDGADAAEAIMTSDTRAKEIAVTVKLGEREITIGGICKGAGMIQPRMTRDGLHATMLCFLTTDAAIAAPLLQVALETAVEKSFNRISIDGDTSTNDTVLVLANGAVGNELLLVPNDKRFAAFQDGLNFVTRELAKMIVLDGEGVTRLVHLHVHGARTPAEAQAAARAIANSALVKTSWFGGDPNWGRIACAVGNSGAEFNPHKLAVYYQRYPDGMARFAIRNGKTSSIFEELVQLVAAREFEIHVRLHAGNCDTVFLATDLSSDYVEFNKGDVSDPSSLGG